MRVVGPAIVALLWASPAAAVDVSGNAGLVSDYRYRGVSLSRGRAAVQGEITLEHNSGVYADLWGSTLGHGSETEIDLAAGYEHDLSGAISIDLSATYYLYPDSGSDNYVEATAIATLTRGPASLALGTSYAPAQRGTGHADNLYLFGTADYALPKTPVTLMSGLGYERGAFDEVARGGKWDWTLGAEVALKPARLGVAYIGTDADGGNRHALVASAFVEF